MEDNILQKSLYPTTLFHFTKEIDALNQILNKKYFEVSYAKEIIFSSKSRFIMGIPMVSFCDIRLSQLHEHTLKYGGVGLGMHKSWGLRSGLNPVLYMSQESNLFKNYNNRMLGLGQSVGALVNEKGRDCVEFSRKVREYRESANIIRYVKNYEGTLNRVGHKPISNYRFADENEWRYVPNVMETEHFVVAAPSGKNTKRDPSKWKEHFNRELRDKNINLKFEWDDIKYIIVRNEGDIDAVILMLQNICPKNKVDKLISRIFCTSQIYDDL
ncbi:abortive infection system antitoxin AbiGi family protein [Cronobacter turicensis]